jgi:GxxExxY protein
MGLSKKALDNLSYKVIGAAIEVHRHLGPGLLESVYQKCLAIEFANQEITFSQELQIPVEYKGQRINTEFRCDFLVEDLIVVEIKSVSELLPIHHAQVINYINLLKVPKGLLINFNVSNLFHQGQKTFVNKYYDELYPF